MSFSISDKLVNIRKIHRFSRKGLEEVSGYKERTIGSYERCENPPTKNYITFISLYFNVDINAVNSLDDIVHGRKKLNRIKRIILMYQDIYGYDDVKMQTLTSYYEWSINEKFKFEDNEDLNSELFELANALNIKPSCFGLVGNVFTLSTVENEKENNTLNYSDSELIKEVQRNNQYENEINEKRKILEINGMHIDKDTYAKYIKQRNTSNGHSAVILETPKLDNKYQTILDLLPYASDGFLEDITNKLQAIKDIQKL